MSKGGRPVNQAYREAVLDAFRGTTMRTMEEVETYLKSVNQYVSYSSTRRIMEILVRDGYLNAVKNRSDNNRIRFIRTGLEDFIKIDRMNLRSYIHEVINRPIPSLITPSAARILKKLMLETLVISAWPETSNPPVAEDYIRDLEWFRTELGNLHRFVDTFLRANPTSAEAQEMLGKEFRSSCYVEALMIAEDRWDRVENDE